MSLILEALEKKGADGESSKQTQSTTAQVNEPSYAAGQNHDASRSHHLVSHHNSASPVSHVSLGWGILLAIAILSALLLGFWLGKGGQFTNSQQTPVHQVSSAGTAEPVKNETQNNRQLPKQPQSLVKTQIQTQTEQAQVNSAVPNTNQQEFSTFFENPPEQQLASVNKLEQKQVDDLAQGKLLTNQQNDVDLSGVSQELLDKFNEAVIDTNTDADFIEPIKTENTASQVKRSERAEPQISRQPEKINQELLARAIANADLDEVSRRKLQALENAVESTQNYSQGSISGSQQSSDEQGGYKTLSQMSENFKQSLPKLQFDMHIYASDGQGWVKVNGRDRYEQDVIADGVTLEQITPQDVILRFRGQRFSMPALSSW